MSKGKPRWGLVGARRARAVVRTPQGVGRPGACEAPISRASVGAMA